LCRSAFDCCGNGNDRAGKMQLEATAGTITVEQVVATCKGAEVHRAEEQVGMLRTDLYGGCEKADSITRSRINLIWSAVRVSGDRARENVRMVQRL
jgi:hypothetical protein